MAEELRNSILDPVGVREKEKDEMLGSQRKGQWGKQLCSVLI